MELRNLYYRSESAAVIRRIRGKLRTWQRRVKDGRSRGPHIGMRRCLVILALAAAHSLAQTSPADVKPLLEKPLATPDVTAFQLRQYMLRNVPRLPAPATAAEWTAKAGEMRRSILDNFVFRGGPREWRESPLRVEDLGMIPGGKGYRMRKLRYEIVPGFYSVAILYEPVKLG